MNKIALSLTVILLASAGVPPARSFAATVWKTETIYGGPPHCEGVSSLALSGVGTPHISFHNGAEGLLMYATTDGAAWAGQTVPVNGPDQGVYSSIAVDSSGRLHRELPRSPGHLPRKRRPLGCLRPDSILSRLCGGFACHQINRRHPHRHHVGR